MLPNVHVGDDPVLNCQIRAPCSTDSFRLDLIRKQCSVGRVLDLAARTAVKRDVIRIGADDCPVYAPCWAGQIESRISFDGDRIPRCPAEPGRNGELGGIDCASDGSTQPYRISGPDLTRHFWTSPIRGRIEVRRRLAGLRSSIATN